MARAISFWRLLLLAVLVIFLSNRLNDPSPRDGTSHPAPNDCLSPGLPKVKLLHTGGTISGAGINRYDSANYEIGVKDGQALILDNPEICQVAGVVARNVANVGSHNIDDRLLLELHREVQSALSDSDMTAVVITHGTDTMEDTAAFLDFTIESEKPVILVGSMRPGTALSHDGPGNLYSGVKVAIDSNTRSRGVLVVMNEEILPAQFTVKFDSNRVDAFKAIGPGPLGFVASGKVHYHYPASRPLIREHFDIGSIGLENGLPQVPILDVYQGFSADGVRDAAGRGALGIVIAGVGQGWIPDKVKRDIDSIQKDTGIVVMVSRRPVSGHVEGRSLGSSIPCGSRDAIKCRIWLQLNLALGRDHDSIAAAAV